MSLSILLIGCGRMGSALLEGWLKSPDFSNASYHIVDPYFSTLPAQLLENKSCRFYDRINGIQTIENADVLFFAVKPKDLEQAVAESKKFIGKNTLLISVAAGKTIASVLKNSSSDAAVVRVMPNLPALIGMGASVMCASTTADALQNALAENLLKSVGEVFWVEDENLINPVTAVSGSGPAYLFLFAEALRDAGVKNGLDEKLAEKLSLITLCGAAEMALESADSLETLREKVTSPKGTTEAALKVFMEGDSLKTLVEHAVTAANRRAKELENG